MMGFRFATAGRILFGNGVLSEAVDQAVRWGDDALVLTGRDASRSDRLIHRLEGRGVRCRREAVCGEPTVEMVTDMVNRHRDDAPDFVVGLGGGSAIDAAKAVAGLIANPGSAADYLEVVGAGKPLERPALPVLAVPTTAGTGAEATANAVLAVSAHRVKVSLRSPFLLPRIAAVDPQLTFSLPPRVTAATGLDALTQLVECLVSHRATPMTDALCGEGLRRGASALERAWSCGEDPEAREAMAFASLMGGIGLANAGLGAVHGFAGPIGGMFDAPHGMVCAVLLPHVMAANIAAIAAAASASWAMERFRRVAVLLTGDGNAEPMEGVSWVRELCRRLEVPALAAFGVTAADIPVLVAKAKAASSMKANPVPLPPEVLTGILAGAL